jgi:hypothetical protein
MKQILLVVLLFVAGFRCEKAAVAGKDVEIYLLAKGGLMPSACKVDANNAKLASGPILRSDDIISYSASTHIFTLQPAAYKSIEALTDTTPFAVTVDREVIYFGIVKSNFSSSSCDQSITMDNMLRVNTIEMRLGYPGLLDGVVIEDKRNDDLLIATLRSLGKLVP